MKQHLIATYNALHETVVRNFARKTLYVKAMTNNTTEQANSPQSSTPLSAIPHLQYRHHDTLTTEDINKLKGEQPSLNNGIQPTPIYFRNMEHELAETFDETGLGIVENTDEYKEEKQELQKYLENKQLL